MVSIYNGRLITPKRDSAVWYSRGYLPHFDGEEVTQHVTFGLFDCLPQNVYRQLNEELRCLEKSEADLRRRQRIQEILDRGRGSCFLYDEAVAALVESSLLYFDSTRYRMHAWCIMPNHVHVLFTPFMGFPLSNTVQSWKSFSANKCNRILGRKGAFWQKDSFDRYIRNEQHFRKALAYIEMNPVKAHLCRQPGDWSWSSARHRVRE